MISKEKEDYLFKLKAELLFRGKDEHEVNDIIEELRIISNLLKRITMMLVIF